VGADPVGDAGRELWPARDDRNADATCEEEGRTQGHANISITFDRYGHLMPGNESEAAERLDAYLARATGTEKAAAVSEP
jgi:hypothetical protein